MNEKLSGCLRYIQRIFKELVNRCQRLLIEIIRTLAVEDLLDEHLAQRDRQLINQPTDSQFAVGDDITFSEEDLAYIQRHLRFLIRAACFLDLINGRTVGDSDILHIFLFQKCRNAVRCLIDLLHAVALRQILDHDHIILINRSNEILTVASEISAHHLQHIAVLSILCLNDQRNPLYIGLDMQLLRPAVDIHQKQIVQKQVLNKIILVKSLLIRYQKILDLKSDHLPNHVNILTDTPCDQNVFKLLLVKYFKILISLYLLRIRRRFGKFRRRSAALFHLVRRHRNRLPVDIHDAQFYSGN